MPCPARGHHQATHVATRESDPAALQPPESIRPRSADKNTTRRPTEGARHARHFAADRAVHCTPAVDTGPVPNKLPASALPVRTMSKPAKRSHTHPRAQPIKQILPNEQPWPCRPGRGMKMACASPTGYFPAFSEELGPSLRSQPSSHCPTHCVCAPRRCRPQYQTNPRALGWNAGSASLARRHFCETNPAAQPARPPRQPTPVPNKPTTRPKPPHTLLCNRSRRLQYQTNPSARAHTEKCETNSHGRAGQREA
jgi:hypothetical protein